MLVGNFHVLLGAVVAGEGQIVILARSYLATCLDVVQTEVTEVDATGEELAPVTMGLIVAKRCDQKFRGGGALQATVASQLFTFTGNTLKSAAGTANLCMSYANIKVGPGGARLRPVLADCAGIKAAFLTVAYPFTAHIRMRRPSRRRLSQANMTARSDAREVSLKQGSSDGISSSSSSMLAQHERRRLGTNVPTRITSSSRWHLQLAFPPNAELCVSQSQIVFLTLPTAGVRVPYLRARSATRLRRLYWRQYVLDSQG